MKKFTCIVVSVLLLLQCVFCKQAASDNKFYECTLSNGVKVILHEDFRTPIAVVGIVFFVGSLDTPVNKYGIGEIIAENIVNKKLHEQLSDLQISYDVQVYKEYTEIVAYMNPKHIKTFFNLICENITDISIENLDILKKQMIINEKLSSYLCSDIVHNSIYQNINITTKNARQLIFNEKELSSISESDVKTFFSQHYQNCPMAVIVTGAIGYKNLIKSLQSSVSNLQKRQKMTFNICKNDNSFVKTINIDSKHVGSSIGYLYRIPQSDNIKLSSIFFEVFYYNAYEFFRKMYPLAFSFSCNSLIFRGDSVKYILLNPKKDVSLTTLKKAYDVFINRMVKQKFSKEYLAKISDEKKQSMQFDLIDLSTMYSKILKEYMKGGSIGNVYTIADDIKKADPAMFNKFTVDNLMHNLLLEITTRYRTHK